MLKPVVLIVTVGLAVGAFAQLPCRKPGTERWPIKTSVPPHARTVRMSLADALSDSTLPELSNVKRDDPRYQDARITDGPVKENELVTVSGWLYLVAFESDDCDFHLQISPTPFTTTNPPTADANSMIVELPSGQYAADPALGAKFATIRAWIVQKLLAGKAPRIGSVHVMQHPVYVRVTGALFYDDAHTYAADHTTGRGKRHLLSKTLWELHPVTALAFAPKPAAQTQAKR